MKKILLFSLLAFFTIAYGQNPRLDSIKNVIANSDIDTVLLRSYAVLSDQCPEEDIPKYTEKGIAIGESTFQDNNTYNKYLGKLYFNKAFYAQISGEKGEEILKLYRKSKAYYEKSDNKKGLAITINSIGFQYKELGDFDMALKNFLEALRIREGINDERGLSQSYNDIAFVYSKMEENEKARAYYQKSVLLGQKMKNYRALGASYLNLGHIYFTEKDYVSAKSYFLKSLEAKKQLSDVRSAIPAYNRLGELHTTIGDLDSALYYFKKGYESLDGTNFNGAKAQSSYFLARTYIDQGNYAKAEPHAKSAYDVFSSLRSLDMKRNVAVLLYKIAKQKRNYKEALDFYVEYKKLNDTIQERLNKKDLFKRQAQFEYEKKTVADSIENAKELAIKNSEIRVRKAESAEHQANANKNLLMFVFSILGLLLVAVFAIIIFKRLKLTREQKIIIEEQKTEVVKAYDELEEKNQEIMDSIVYAKRIQKAILPPDKLVKEYLEDSFIFYLPKDIVAGDFYWMQPISNGVLFAAADCTGHGVPGAMVSVVCNSGLNRSVKEFGLDQPGEILDKTRELVISEFEKSEEEVKDGMDISLCKVVGHTLSYAGAHNPLWIIRKGGTEVEEIKANKQPIGKHPDPVPYNTHTVKMNEGDTIYIFSDGFPDQFGGEKGKKYKSSNFKKFLIQIQIHAMEKQHQLIQEEFDRWKGPLEQLDDVCVIGYRF